MSIKLIKKTFLVLLIFLPFITWAGSFDECGVVGDTIIFCPPIVPQSLEGLLANFLAFLQTIIGVLAIIFIIIGGIIYMTSAGNETRIIWAKNTITGAITGLVIGLVAPSFLREISIIMGWEAGAKTPVPSLTQVALNVLNFLLSLVGVIALIMLIIGALTYITATGDEERIDKGKKIIKYSIVGLVVALGSLVIVKQLALFFSV